MWHPLIAFLFIFLITLPLVYKRVFPVGGYSVLGAAFGLVMSALSYAPLFFLAMTATGIFIDLVYSRFIRNAVAWRVKFFVFVCAVIFILVVVGYGFEFFPR